MNNIYIINNYFDYEIKLIFNTNTFINNNISYKFEIIDIDKLKIYWLKDEYEIYYTNDSYVYYSNIDLKDIIKKYFIIKNNKYYQALINFKTNILKELNESNNLSIYFKDLDFLNNKNIIDNIININWNNLIESYNNIDNNTLIISTENNLYSNKLIEKELNFNKNIPIYIFIHICCIENWKEIFEEQIDIIKKSGLYNIIEKIKIGILGELFNINDLIFNDEKFEVIYIDKRINLYEIHTINSIKSFCSNNLEDDEIYILYIHTKGVRNAGNKIVTKSWRNMMHYFLIEKYIDCINNLYKYDTLGNNIVNLTCNDNNNINKNHSYHYSGNFWWSKKTYINKLNYINIDYTLNSYNTRYRAENWILSNYPNGKFGIIFQDSTNTHPYHRYVFDYYRNMKFMIKLLQ
jgi:hypothetical protein